MKSVHILFVAAVITPFSASWAEDRGGRHVTQTVNANGTAITSERSHDVSVARDGTTETVESEKSVVDPKGMGNSLSATKQVERKTKPNGDFSESRTIERADGTKEEESRERKSSDHWLNRGKTTTTTHTSSIDPKGLGNKRTVTETEKIEANADGSARKTVTREVDGTTVSEDMNVERK